MQYRRVLLKLSGESLAGGEGEGISTVILESYVSEIAAITKEGHQVAIVIGGGNIFRGLSGTEKGYDRVKGDQMGMLATVINSLAIQNEIASQGGRARLFTAIRMEPVGELYSRDKAVEAMEEGFIAIIAGGTGNPFFTTDTAAALRAVEINADLLLKGTRVDGVYSADPEKYPDAVRYTSVTFDEAIEKRLRIMDMTAFTLCRENSLPVIVFNMNEAGALRSVLKNRGKFTLLHQ